MGNYVSETDKGFKESQIFDEKIRYYEGFSKPWHVYFDYGIRGEKYSRVKKGDFDTEEEAKRMLEEYKRSFADEAARVDQQFKTINTISIALIIVLVLLFFGLL